MTTETTRRTFIKTSTLSAAAALTTNPIIAYAAKKPDNPKSQLKAAMATRIINPKNGGVPRGHYSEKKIYNIHSQLRVQATVLEDQSKSRALFFACDFCHVNKKIIDQIKSYAKQKYNIAPKAFCFNVSHTHSAPVLCVEDAYKPHCFDPEYAEFAIGQAKAVIDDAMKKLTPAKLTYKQYLCTSVAINRRKEVDGLFIMRPNPDGPVDHRVQVIEIKSADDKNLIGAMIKYACHPVTVGPTGLGPDYPGFMRDYFEKNHPGATAMFIQGCGGDTRIQIVDQDVTKFTGKSVEAAQRFGRDLALSVEWALAKQGQPITGPIKISLKTIKVPLQKYSKETIAKIRDSRWEGFWKDYINTWAKKFISKIDAGEKLPTGYDYIVQTVSIGLDSPNPFVFAGLQGEVVTEYGFKIADKLKNTNTIVAGYCNNCQTYIPTAKVLSQGGYESFAPLVDSLLPAKFSPQIEPLIVNTAVNLAKNQF